MVGGAVAFDGQDVAAGLGGVLDGEVDPVAGGPVLGGQFQPAPQQGVADVYLERVQRGLVLDLVAEVDAVGFGVLEVLPQQLDAFGGGAARGPCRGRRTTRRG